MIEKYYEDELRYLYESGKEFAKAYPDRAQFLNIDAVGDRDPYVERLFEGFAFLTGRIREKIDDSFPELTEGLINLMWPNFLHEFPSTTIVQFAPRKGFLQETRTLPRGSELLSGPAGAERAICKFTTTTDVRLNPITLERVEKTSLTGAKASLALHFQFGPGAQWKNLKLSPLRLYLHAELPTALMLYDFLTSRVSSCRVVVGDNVFSFTIDAETAITPGGFSGDESILPLDSRSFQGYSLLQEYFAFPEKFFFVDLNGLESSPAPDPSPQRFSVHFTFDADFPPDKQFTKDNFRLFCSPAANLFKKSVEPVVYDGKETQYRIVADAGYPASVRPHSIISVVGIDRTSGARTAFESLYAFTALAKNKMRTYAPQYRVSPGGNRELYVTFGGELLEAGPQGPASRLQEINCTIDAWCTNGVIPREEIRDNGITNPGASFPDFVTFTNITRPTLPVMPPADGEYLWVFLSHLSSTFTSLSSPATLKPLLRLYDWSGSEGRGRKIDAITEVSSKPVEQVVNGASLRGVEFTCGVQETSFLDIGDVRLFGQVLKEFLAHYISINTFLELAIVLKPSGTTIRWNSLKGKKWPI
ncbi:MAG TPA: type VI secretion system baseplate subunit TssF [Chitinivibrionales bacterium]